MTVTVGANGAAWQDARIHHNATGVWACGVGVVVGALAVAVLVWRR